MSQSVEGEVGLESTSILLNEHFPHTAACGVVGVGEVDRTVKHLFEFFDVTFRRLTRATDDSDASLVIDPLALPLNKGLLDARRITSVGLFSTTFTLLALLFLSRENALTFVNINNGRSVLFSCFENHSHHLLRLLLGHVLVRDDAGAQVHNQGLGFRSNGFYHQGLACASGAIEQDASHFGGMSSS